MKLAAREIVIENELRRMGVGGTRKGFWMIVWGVSLALEDPLMLSAVTEKLYPAVAEICETNKQCVMRDMRSLVEWCWNFGDREAMCEILGRRLMEKPTVGEFIDLLTSNLRKQGWGDL